MAKDNWIRKCISMFLVLAMVLQYIPLTALAVDGDVLPEHPEHEQSHFVEFGAELQSDCTHPEMDENGFCDDCGGFQSAALNQEDYYEIGNAGQMFWFAELVNGGERDADAKLTADIDLEGREWTTICSTGLYFKVTDYPDLGYEGTFDGNGHVISDFVVKGISGQECTSGLFGTLSGTIRNLGVDNMTFELNDASDVRAAAIAGQMIDGSLVENCYVINSTLTPNQNIVGGVAGCNYAGTIRSCYTYNVKVAANERCGNLVSDIRGDISADDRPGTVINCWTDADRVVGTQTSSLVSDCRGSVASAYFADGTVVWYLNGQSADGIWKQNGRLPGFTGTTVTALPNTGSGEPAKVDGVYQIGTKDELCWFASYVNIVNADADAVLVADIDLGSGAWAPIGTVANPYTGTFDGQGHAITNLNASITAGSRWGLFGEISGSTIRDFSLDGDVTVDLPSEQTFYFAVAAGATNSTISDVHSSVDVTVLDSYIKNGIAGIAAVITTSTVVRCSYSGTIDMGNARLDCGGGIVAYGNYNNAHVIRDCGFYGTIKSDVTESSSGQIGGILGYYRGNNLTVENCLSVGTMEIGNPGHTGMIAGRIREQSSRMDWVARNYFLEGDVPAFSNDPNDSVDMGDYGADADNAEVVSAERMASGEVAYLLQGDKTEQVWGQKLGEEPYPVLYGEKVYAVCNCLDEIISYSNVERASGEHRYENGFCAGCDIYEVPELNADGFYEIGNAGQLYWFADQVNNGANNINAILTADIVDNENLMEKITIAEDGTATVNEGETIREWAPIGDFFYGYSGTFDGNGKTVTGLYRNASANFAGLIGYLKGSGKVQNVTVADSYFCGDDYVGGVVGYSSAGSTVSNCHNTGTVSGSDYVGGVAGHNGGSMTECCNAGTVSGSNFVGGVVGYGGSMTECCNAGTVSGICYVGGVVGRNEDGTVSNCYNTGYVSGYYYVGGVVGHCYAGGIVSNCYNTGSVSAGDNVGGVVGVNHGTVTNCFYLDTCGAAGEGTAKTEAQFASGEVAYLLQGDKTEQVWGQKIGEEPYPVLYGEKVYAVYNCLDEIIYSNVERASGEHSYENGFCIFCGGYEAPELNADGFYKIGNAGQLYWFAAQVNNGANNINAILTADIEDNENLMEKITIAEDGTATVNEGETIREWVPIGGSKYYYSGTFDGNGKTVTGLYRNVSAKYVGLIGYLEGSGKVQNVTVADSYFCGGNYVGGVAGYNGGSMTECCNAGTVSGKYEVGGVAGWYVGGVAGYNGGSMTECCNAGTVSGRYYVGGVAGWLNDSTVSNCYNTGTVSGSYYVGGVVGRNKDGTVSNCYNTGTVSSDNYVGGVAGYCVAGGTVSNCYNTGSVSAGMFNGGVVGVNYGTVTNCYNTGSVSAGVCIGGVVGDNSGTVTNCFYLVTCGAAGKGTAKTKAQFASGEVAWLLNGSADEGELVWKQNIGTDAIPGFEGEIVSYSSKTGAYYNKGNHEHQYEAVVTDPTCTEPGYTTYTCTVCGDSYVADETFAEHSYENGFCIVCGGYEAPELNADGFYEIGNAGQLYWFAAQVNNGANNINAILTDNIVVNENLMDKLIIAADGTATVREGETVRPWTPIGDLDYIFYLSGTFDGNGKTVSGLYHNNGHGSCVGLVGYLNEGGEVREVAVADSYFCGYSKVGGVVGYNLGTVSYCCSSSYVKGDIYIGGVVGYNLNGTVSSCYNIGTVNGSSNADKGGIAGRNEGSVLSCVYLNTCGATNSGVLMTAEDFASGLATYYLQLNMDEVVWGQKLGVDPYPVLYGDRVYRVIHCNGDILGYSNDYIPTPNHQFTEEGFCTVCGGFVEPKLNADGFYEITKAGELYWFAEATNNHDIVMNAILMNDIVVNENLMDKIIIAEDGTATVKEGETVRRWTPIGDESFNFAHMCGIFDGNGKTISGLFHDNSSWSCVGLIGYVREGGVVQNVTVADSYFNGNSKVAGVVGHNRGTVRNCANISYIKGDTFVGGVVGQNWYASVQDCYTYGEIVGRWNVGGVVGVDSGEVINSYYLDTFTEPTVGAAKSAEQFASGEVAYLLQGDKTEQVWGQKIGEEPYPVLYGEKVYPVRHCNGEILDYANEEIVTPEHQFTEEGFCTACSGYKEPKLNGDNFYEITNIGELYWFAAQVNKRQSNINAILMNDIVDNENLMDKLIIAEDGTATVREGETVRSWIIIGGESNSFTYLNGCFDGNGKTISGLYYNDGTRNDVGLFGYVYGNGMVRNVTVKDSYFHGNNRVGGVAGYNTGSVKNSGSFAFVKGNVNVGGLNGYLYTGTLIDSYFAGTVMGAEYVGGVSGRVELDTLDNCFYLDTCGAAGYGTAKTEAQFASGEVAYLLQGDKTEQVWGQKLGEDPYPVVFGEKVYAVYNCLDEIISYSNVERASAEHSYENGFCTVCGGYEAPELNADGFYEIGNAGQLYWFAQKVNSGGNEINAILTDNIVDNENLMEKITIAEDGTATVNEGETIREWAPIGGSKYPYSGTFDGNGKTVTGLYRNVSANFVGLIGYLKGSGKVQNVTVADSYFCGNYVGGVVGYSCAGSTVSNCHNTGSVSGSDYVGGVAGYNGGSMTECCNAGTVSGKFDVGGVAGCNDVSTLSNCYNTGSVSGYYYVGGVVGSCDAGATVSNCYNTGSVSGRGSKGGVVGVNTGTVTNCFYLNTCGAAGEGTAKTEAKFASGEVAWLLNGSTDEGELVWKQNIGTDAIPGFEGEIVSYSTKTGAYYNKGNHEHQYEAVVTDPTCTDPGYTTYTCSVCGDSYVADETSALGHSYENGFCTGCGGYEAPELNADGFYEIGNAGQLYWFADQVNNGANNINAILTADIVDNENLMEKITIAEDGTATVNEGETIREWAPIGGLVYYSGTFDGNGKTVTGLYSNVSANYVGLIGSLEGSGKVQNVTVADSYFCGGNCVGGVVGYSAAGTTVSNCHNTGTVSGSYDVGGVVGHNGGSMTECCNAGTVSGSNYVGGVAGWNDVSTLSNCYNTGTVSGSKYVGGVAGWHDDSTLSNCYNTGTVSGSKYVGGVVGYCYTGGTVSNCFYLDTCGAAGEGTAKTEAQFASGEVAWLLNGSTDEGELVWKQNIGTDAIPGFEGEIVSYSSKTGAYYNKGNHEHQYEAVVTDPICTEPGYTTYTCSVCGDSYVADETSALGHEWNGTSCTRCDAKRENPFVDVPEDIWYINPVLWALEKGITSGVDDTHFGPNAACTRAHVVTFLWAAEGKPEPKTTVNPFVDVKEGDWFFKAVLWAKENGITSGLDDTHFGPDETCTREQVVTFLWAANGRPESSAKVNFSDVPAGAWYYAPVAWAVENKITSGMGDGTFGVGQTCNRAQVVTFLYAAK